MTNLRLTSRVWWGKRKRSNGSLDVGHLSPAFIIPNTNEH